jgi:hypothetical protein
MMATSQYPARAVRAKTNEVVEYHKDEERPGKPLFLLIPGGLIALGSLALIIWVAYAALFDGTMDSDRATGFLFLLAPVYIVGVFLFSYGYELYDLSKAIRLTIVVVVITVSAVIIIAVLFALLSGSSSSSSKSSSKSSSSSSSGSGGGIGDAIGSFIGGSSSSSSGTNLGSSSSSYSGGGIGPIFIGSTAPRVVTHEVTHEVIKEVPTAPPPPQPLTCPFCGRPYIPAETKFACPNCGAATPKELLPPDTGADAPSA